eukprot:4179106-Alexandrium_andersonii.AAC.1
MAKALGGRPPCRLEGRGVQGDLQSRGAPRASLRERHRVDRICVKHAFQGEVALLPDPHALHGTEDA